MIYTNLFSADGSMDFIYALWTPASMSRRNNSWIGQCLDSEISLHSRSIFGDRIISSCGSIWVRFSDRCAIKGLKLPNNPLFTAHSCLHVYPIQSTIVSNCEAVSQSSNYVIVNLRTLHLFQPAKSQPSEAVYNQPRSQKNQTLIHKCKIVLLSLSVYYRLGWELTACGCLSWSLLCSSRIESRCRFFCQYLIWGE